MDEPANQEGRLRTMGENRIRTTNARCVVVRDDDAATRLTTETAVRSRP